MTESENKRATLERRALKTSAAGYLIFALLGIGFFLLTRSEAILLDAVYSLTSVGLALLSLRVIGLLDLPGSRRFHFGYAHFEPLINTCRVALILGVDAFALISAIAALTGGGRPLDTGNAVIYGTLSAIACLTMSAIQNRNARNIDSSILRLDARAWWLDGIISSGIAIAFLGGHLLERNGFSSWVPFVDPILVIVLVVATFPVMLKSLRESVPQILLSAPPEERQSAVREKAEIALADIEHRELSIRMIQVGRVFYVMIHVILPKGVETISIRRCDRARRDLAAAIGTIGARTVIDVVFTADDGDALKLFSEDS